MRAICGRAALRIVPMESLATLTSSAPEAESCQFWCGHTGSTNMIHIARTE